MPKRRGLRLNPRVSPQQTIRESASFSGIGLHSGNRVTMTLLPAPANTGVRFRRVDLDGRPEIEARVENVGETNRSTSLARGNVKIHTVEHVLAALAGAGIDNAVVELDANEPPIGDGSAREYGRILQRAGVLAQSEPRHPIRLSAPIQLEAGESSLAIFPQDTLKITCTSADRQGRHTQHFSLEVTTDSWAREISHARTFCFFEEIEYLIKNGLIRGGSLENAVVIRDDAVLTTEPLRYPEEFVRHKILDIIGDLSLLGRPLLGHIVAIKPGHAANCELARRIEAQLRQPLEKVSAFVAPPPAPAEAAAPGATPLPTALDIMDVMKILPHRYPFLMVDRVAKIEGNRIIGLKNVSSNEPFFQGHFPGHPVMPGVMQLEAIAQVAGILMLKQADNLGKIAYFMSAENVKWRKPVRPGDQLEIDVELLKSRGKTGKARGVCRVGGDVVSEADVAFMLIDR